MALPSRSRDEHMKYPVTKASSKGDLPELNRLVVERWKLRASMEGEHIAEYVRQEGADPHANSVFWRTPLHYGVEKGCRSPNELEELLLAEGAEINVMANSDRPLQPAAVSMGQEDIVQFLLSSNTDPNAISLLLFYRLLDSILARLLKA